MWRVIILICAAALLALCPACKILLPAHPNSNARSSQDVKLQFLTDDDITNDPNLKAAYDVAFPELLNKDRESRVTPLAAPLAAAAIGAGINYISQSLKQEAELYEQQWIQKPLWTNGFWVLSNKPIPKRDDTSVVESESFTEKTTREITVHPGPATTNEIRTETSIINLSTNHVAVWADNYIQNIYGFRLRRYVKDKVASELAFGFAPVEGQGLFFVKPLSYQCTKARAKVLSNRFPVSYLAVFPWILKYPGTFVSTTVDVSIAAEWVEKLKVHTDTIASFKLTYPDYNIADGKPWFLGQKGSKIPNAPVGVFGGVPISSDSKGQPIAEQGRGKLKHLGVFSIGVVVTEKDASNAKNQIEYLETVLDKNKTNIQSKASSLLGL